jgi:hypothetical protein
MRPRIFKPIAWGLVLLALGCGLGQGGLAQMTPSTGTSHDSGTGPFGTGGTEDGSVADDGPASGDDAGSADGASSSSDSNAAEDVDNPLDAPTTVPTGPCLNDAAPCIVVPTGWTLVAFTPDQSTLCPAGFTSGSMDFVDGPAVGASKCSCGTCTVTSAPTCNSGEIPVHYDETISAGAGTCDLVAMPGTGPLINSPPGSCGTDLYQGSYADFDISYTSPPAAGGACTAPGAPSGVATSTGVDRACVADTAQAANCNGNACSPSIGDPFKPCIMATGAVACPAGPLSVRHEVGTAASVTCPGCGCSVAADCSGTVTLYTDTRCTTGPFKVAADGSCNPIHLQHASYNSYIYSGGAPTDVSCAASDPGAPTAGLVNPTTICCAP